MNQRKFVRRCDWSRRGTGDPLPVLSWDRQGVRLHGVWAHGLLRTLPLYTPSPDLLERAKDQPELLSQAVGDAAEKFAGWLTEWRKLRQIE